MRYNGFAAQISSERPVTVALWLLEQAEKIRYQAMCAGNYTEMTVRIDTQASGPSEAPLGWPKPGVLDLEGLGELVDAISLRLKPIDDGEV
jgi:hypothetical protein